MLKPRFKTTDRLDGVVAKDVSEGGGEALIRLLYPIYKARHAQPGIFLPHQSNKKIESSLEIV